MKSTLYLAVEGTNSHRYRILLTSPSRSGLIGFTKRIDSGTISCLPLSGSRSSGIKHYPLLLISDCHVMKPKTAFSLKANKHVHKEALISE
jgi:hypothetical protein